MTHLGYWRATRCWWRRIEAVMVSRSTSPSLLVAGRRQNRLPQRLLSRHLPGFCPSLHLIFSLSWKGQIMTRGMYRRTCLAHEQGTWLETLEAIVRHGCRRVRKDISFCFKFFFVWFQWKLWNLTSEPSHIYNRPRFQYHHHQQCDSHAFLQNLQQGRFPVKFSASKRCAPYCSVNIYVCFASRRDCCRHYFTISRAVCIWINCWHERLWEFNVPSSVMCDSQHWRSDSDRE